MSKITKKIISVVTGVMVTVWLVGPSVAYGLTAEELQAQIDALLAQLADLQAQLAELQGEPSPTVTGCTITSFDRNLKQGMSGDDVNCLQIVLNSDPDTQLASSGVGSPGEETSYFGPLTRGGVVKFQEKYADEVLASWGLTAGTGFVGSTTRAKLNELLTAPVGEEEEEEGEAGEEEEEEEEEVAAAGLTVGLASDTPASVTVADNANTDFTKFTLTAGSEGDVKISKIYVTRTGLSLNSDLENVKIVDADTGVYHGSIGSFNVDNRAMITFTKKLVISAGTSRDFLIRAGIVNGATAGKTAALGIASADDIVSDASEVTGAFPVMGNEMSVVQLAIGTATIAEDGTTIDSKPDVGDTDVTVNQFKVTAGSAEGLIIEQITVMKSGTTDASDTGNIELYSVTDGQSLGTVENWNAEDKASWSGLNITIAKGATHRFKVMVDILDGPSLTVNADIVDGSDTLMSVKGDTYGFYITPTRSGSWNGLGSNNQTINAGALNVAKSAATPATGNISAGDDIELGVFDFDATGEEVKITALTLDFTLGTMTASQVTNVSIYDENGGIVAGPLDCSGTGSTCSLAYTDTFIVPVGVHQYTVKAKIADDVSTGDTIVVAVDRPGTSITATGMTSNSSITPTPAADVSANTLTVSAGSLTVTTLDTPAARSVAAGANDFVWATASLDAGTSGEDVQVSTVSVLDTTGAQGDADDIDNMEIWADLTDADSARGDAYETKVSDSENPSGNSAGADVTTAFTLTQTITAPKGSFVRVALVADLAAGASASGTPTHTFTFSAVTATGATTGQDISESTSGSGQAMTVASSGTLTISQDASAPTSADILIGGKTHTLNVFRLAANNVEDLDLDNITLSVTGGTTVDTFYFYHGDTLIQTRPGGTAPRVDFGDGTVTIPANGNVKITVKAKMLTVDESVVTSNTNVGAIIDGTSTSNSVQTTGLASGASVDSGSNSVTGSVHQLYKSRPYFAVNSASPSGNITAPSSNFLLAIFDVTAESTEDITFENADGDQIKVQIAATVTDSDGTAGTWYLKDETGTTLSSISVADTSLVANGSMTFLFEDSTFTVPAGQTKKLYVYGDLTDFEDDGDSIQIWLDDAADANCTFGIDGTGGYAEGAIIFRGDIYAGSFVNPS